MFQTHTAMDVTTVFTAYRSSQTYHPEGAETIHRTCDYGESSASDYSQELEDDAEDIEYMETLWNSLVGKAVLKDQFNVPFRL